MKNNSERNKELLHLVICEGLYVTLVLSWMLLLFSSVSLAPNETKTGNLQPSHFKDKIQ